MTATDKPVSDARHDLGSHDRELILDARNVGVNFKVEGGVVNAVRNVSFQLHKGETIALVGESGSGKSVTARTLMKLLTKRATILPETRITLSGQDIVAMDDRAMRKLRGNDIAMIFQEPMSSLNPVYTIGQQICEILHLHNRISRREAMEKAEALLTEVQIPEPRARLNKELGQEFLNTDAFEAMAEQMRQQDVGEQLRQGDVDGAFLPCWAP